MAGSRPVLVVGVDGSAGSKDALRWAARQAALVGGEVHATTAWHLPTTYGYAPDYADVDFAAEARRMLDEVVAETLGATPSVPVLVSVVEGHAAAVLIEASRAAELLVVGSRGHGVFAATLLGSVGQHCVHHATCPVVVVRHPTTAGSTGIPAAVERGATSEADHRRGA
jgi:nucleotide-binding universal stress UspA family protein